MAATFDDEAAPGDVPWLVLSLKWPRGDELLWWRHGAAGYTIDLNRAGRFTERQARRHACDGLTLAVPESAAMEVARPLLLVANNPGIIAGFLEQAFKAEIGT